MKQYFEYIDEKSSKFWEIEVLDIKTVVRYGKIGTDGQTQEKEFESAEKATKEAEKLIKEKTKKGYVEKSEGNAISKTSAEIKKETKLVAYQSKNSIIQEIESVLKTKYKAGFGYKFLGNNALPIIRTGLKIDDFKAKIGLELPEIFYEFYEWLLNVDFPKKNIDKLTYMESHQHQLATLTNIVDNTKMWQEIQAKQPKREWKEGFVALLSYNDAYQIVIDTKGEICGQKGALAYWDFKGGGCYYVNYTSFESFLKTKLELLKQNLYFPPSLDGDENDEDSLTYDDFIYGEPAEEIETIIEILNGKSNIVNFKL